MHRVLYIIFFSLTVSNCSIKPVAKHHGIPLLETKQSSLTVNSTNKNDILNILGNPSTKSKFDDDIWIYIETKQTQSKLMNFGKMKVYKNDVLVLELDEYGILKKKTFYNKDDLKNIKLDTDKMEANFENNSFIYDFFSSMRQKVNDPLGKRVKKRQEINQR